MSVAANYSSEASVSLEGFWRLNTFKAYSDKRHFIRY